MTFECSSRSCASSASTFRSSRIVQFLTFFDMFYKLSWDFSPSCLFLAAMKTETLLLSLEPIRCELMWTPITKTQFQVLFRCAKFSLLSTSNVMPKTVKRNAYPPTLSAKSHNVPKRAKITKEIKNFCNRSLQNSIKSVAKGKHSRIMFYFKWLLNVDSSVLNLRTQNGIWLGTKPVLNSQVAATKWPIMNSLPSEFTANWSPK